MSEPITLTTYEIDELIHAIQLRAPISDPVIVLHTVIDGLNKLREPLPVGTVRADDDGNIAVKVKDSKFFANDQWFVHRLESASCSGLQSDEYVQGWPIVHRPLGEQ